jgi:hypothetical protein
MFIFITFFVIHISLSSLQKETGHRLHSGPPCSSSSRQAAPVSIHPAYPTGDATASLPLSCSQQEPPEERGGGGGALYSAAV